MAAQYIVCKIKKDGTVIAGTPPKVHDSYTDAKVEAERLAASVENANGFLIFKSVARSERTPQIVPVRTVELWR